MYDKIKALISRNDFVTAEKLLEKHSADLSEQQKKELWDFIADRQRENQQTAQKIEKYKKRCRRWNSHSRTVLSMQIILGRIVLVGLILFGPYLKNKISAWPEKFEIPLMEILLLIYLLVVSLYCALWTIDAYTDKIHRRVIKRSENEFAEEERNWLIALVFFSLWSFVQLWKVFSMVT